MLASSSAVTLRSAGRECTGQKTVTWFSAPTRFVIGHNPDAANRDAHIRAQLVAQLEPGLALPPPQDLLLPGVLDVVEDDGGARREAVVQHGQRRIAGQPVPGGVRRWAVHQQQVDEDALQRTVEFRGHRSVVIPCAPRSARACGSSGAWMTTTSCPMPRGPAGR